MILPFTAVAPISGAQRRCAAGEIVVCDTAQGGSKLTLEAGGAYTLIFLVERSVFEACGKHACRTAGSIKNLRPDDGVQMTHRTSNPLMGN